MTQGLIYSVPDVCEFGRRLVLFPKGKQPQYYLVKGEFAERYCDLLMDGKRVRTFVERVQVKEIYPEIKLLYDREANGVLIARRVQQGLPLRSTGKGMGKRIAPVKPLHVYEQLLQSGELK